MRDKGSNSCLLFEEYRVQILTLRRNVLIRFLVNFFIPFGQIIRKQV
jgi:hypothetical protein